MFNYSYYEVLNKRKELLERRIEAAEKIVEDTKEYSIKVSKERGKTRFYIKKQNEKRFTYTSDINQCKLLSNSVFTKQTIPIMKRELKNLNKLINSFSDTKINCLLSEKSSRNELLNSNPYETIDMNYRCSIMSQKYKQLGFSEDSPIIYSLSGKRVRSKTEAMIIDCLDARGIDYQYEPPILTGDKIQYPDFRILRKSDQQIVYWEHMGMISNSEYLNKQLEKLADYEKAGIVFGKNLFITFETREIPLNRERIMHFIDTYLL